MELAIGLIVGLFVAGIVAWILIRGQKEQMHQMQEMQKLMSDQINNASNQMLRERQNELEAKNKESMSQLMQPLRQQMDDVRRLMSETKSANEKSTSSLEGALKAMVEQTGKLGTDAQTLANALRNKGKVHGDWGEQVLSDILRDSGLREGEEFMTQVSYKDKRGNELRPDVVINMPDPLLEHARELYDNLSKELKDDDL